MRQVTMRRYVASSAKMLESSSITMLQLAIKPSMESRYIAPLNHCNDVPQEEKMDKEGKVRNAKLTEKRGRYAPQLRFII